MPHLSNSNDRFSDAGDTMRFLVIGASGFVGQNMLAYLEAHGNEAIGTQSSLRKQRLIKFNLLEDRIGDCVERAFFSKEGQLFVIICAVISNMDICLQDRKMSHLVNVEKTIQLIEDVRTLKAKPVFLSSCFVFDGTIGYYNETHLLSPANEYGRHKAEVEGYLKNRVPEAFIARLDKIVGDNPNQHQLLAHWYKNILEEQPIVCLEGSLLSPTYVKDVAQAILLACEQELKGIYHVSNSEFFYRDELARQFSYALGKTPNIISKPLKDFNFPDNRALKSYLDGSKFVKATGMKFTPMREVFKIFSTHFKKEGCLI